MPAIIASQYTDFHGENHPRSTHQESWRSIGAEKIGKQCQSHEGQKGQKG
ncbi:MAG TPA: hypothetical protein VNS33_06315 [Bradyrhizobium sp.]|nr:hypothetical protein [Bradyrhizobium sp.]